MTQNNKQIRAGPMFYDNNSLDILVSRFDNGQDMSQTNKDYLINLLILTNERLTDQLRSTVNQLYNVVNRQQQEAGQQ